MRASPYRQIAVSKKTKHQFPGQQTRATALKQNGLRAFRQNKFTEALQHWQQC